MRSESREPLLKRACCALVLGPPLVWKGFVEGARFPSAAYFPVGCVLPLARLSDLQSGRSWPHLLATRRCLSWLQKSRSAVRRITCANLGVPLTNSVPFMMYVLQSSNSFGSCFSQLGANHNEIGCAVNSFNL